MKAFVPFLILFLAIPVYAIETEGYDTVTLSRTKDPPTPFCPVTKVSDNDKCMSCHILKMKDGKAIFGLREIPLKSRFDDKPASIDIVIHNGEVVGWVTISSTGSDKLRSIADYYYTRPELKRLVMELQTPGGSVMDAWRSVGVIMEMQSRGIVVEVRCYGMAASAGVILLAAGDIGERYVNKHAEIMIHKVWTFSMFDLKNPDTAEDQARTLKHFQQNINNFLLSRSRFTKQKLEECLFKKDFWMTGEQAVDFGLADRFIE